MYFAAHWAMLLALLSSSAAAGFACIEAWSGQDKTASWLERAHLIPVLLLILASTMLLRALIGHDFSLAYVAKFTDTSLPLLYTIAAFWRARKARCSSGADHGLGWPLTKSC
jgi:cytochrome c-type biogenesis protein CcmF